MNMPGFNAESSLGPAIGFYRGKAVYFGGSLAAKLGTVQPQQLHGFGTIFGLDCFGSVGDCVQNFCNDLTGQDRAKCVAACLKPSVCGGCSCRCAPNCARTCERVCTRSTPSAFLRCRGPCFPDVISPAVFA